MNHTWSNRTSNSCLHRNQISGNISRNQNLNKKAYLNPEIVNYEFIKRRLTKNCLQGGNKIHVNPNFRGNGLNNFGSGSHPRFVNAVKSQDMLLPRPGTSNMVNVRQENSSTNSALVESERNLSCAMSVPLQSRFKKVNAVKTKNESLYSWSKITNNSHSLQSDSYHNNMPSVNTGSVLKKMNNFKYSHQAYTSHKNIWGVPNETSQLEKNHSIYKSKTKIINKSKTKLLNNAFPKSKLFLKDKVIKRQLNLSKFAYNKNKKSSISRVAKAVRNKYIYLNNLEQFKKSKYKIDKRNKLPETTRKKSNPNRINDITKLFPSYFYNKIKPSSCNVYNIDSCKSVSKVIHLWRKSESSDKITQKIINNEFPNRRVVKIGGILYKSTANKLTLASKKADSGSKKAANTASKGKRNYVVYVRGEKFILENNGKTLRRQCENTTNEKALLLTPKRIDIGGVTYVQKSQNVLIRTNVHEARYLVNKAKNKSIALLTNLHKRSSVPCMIYHRLGRCTRHTEGLCMYKHDPKNIAVCKKFIKGNCTDNNCFLSHQVVQEKMATCHFFLNGLCVRENCPFLHVKLNENAAICENFLQGFCKLGKECSKRHFHQCPVFDKSGSCSLGPKCPYPHKKPRKTENSCENLDKSKQESQNVQYYVHSDIQRKQKKIKGSIVKVKDGVNTKLQKKGGRKKSLSQNNSDQSSHEIKCFPKRIKLDKLPCFIPLDSDS